MKRILLCPPTNFDIEYEINPWMHVERKVDKAKAMAAYDDLKRIYESLGVQVFEIPQEKDLPDMVYVTDTGHAVGDIFIAANFRYPERRRESAVVAKYLEDKFGFTTAHIPDGIFFEGHGDLVVSDEVYFMGYGKRSMIEALPYLQKYISQPVIPIELVDPYYYHLDTCFAILNPEVALINPTSFTKKGLEQIHSHFKRVIEASPIDHQVLACNLVTIDNHLITALGISDTLQTELEKLGFIVHLVDTVEYRKGGGSVRCMTFEF